MDTDIKIYAIALVDDIEQTDNVIENFHNVGFEANEIVTGSLMISANKKHFEQVFSCKLTQDSKGAHYVHTAKENSSTILPLDNLKSPLKQNIQIIELQKPIDFGPTNF